MFLFPSIAVFCFPLPSLLVGLDLPLLLLSHSPGASTTHTAHTGRGEMLCHHCVGGWNGEKQSGLKKQQRKSFFSPISLFLSLLFSVSRGKLRHHLTVSCIASRLLVKGGKRRKEKWFNFFPFRLRICYVTLFCLFLWVLSIMTKLFVI